MKKIFNNKISTWLISILIMANIATLAFFWIGHFKNQKENSIRSKPRIHNEIVGKP